VRVRIRDITADPDWYWTGAGWSTDENNWVKASTPTATSWSYGDPPTITWQSGHEYWITPRGTDNADNTETSLSTSTFIFDSSEPDSLVSVPGEGSYKKSLTEISGTAEDKPTDAGLVNAELKDVWIRIRDVTSDPDEWWTGTAWSTTTIKYDQVDGTSSWTYSFNDNNWKTGHEYWINVKAYDNVPNEEVDISTRTFIFDKTAPESNINTPSAGDKVSSLSEINGDASDKPDAPLVNSGLDKVEIQIIDLTPNPDEYWNDQNNVWITTSTWITATDKYNWYYTITSQTTTWKNGHDYLIKSKATDNALNVEVPAGDVSFTYDTEPPASAVDIPQDEGYSGDLTSIEGTANDNKTGVNAVWVKIERNSDGYHYNETIAGEDKWQFGVYWNPCIGEESWYYDISTAAWTYGESYSIQSKAEDEVTVPTSNMEVPTSSNTFTFDDRLPSSSITYPLTPVNSEPTIQGTAQDDSPGVLNEVRVRLWREVDPNNWWDKENTQWTNIQVWNVADSTTDWATWSLSGINWEYQAEYKVASKAQDEAGSWEVPTSSVTFKYDTNKPDSSITTPQQDQFYNSLTTISGTSSDTGPGSSASGVTIVKLQIKKLTPSTTYYWDEYSEWQTDPQWLNASGTDPWTYSFDDSDWESGRKYQVISKAKDDAGNEETSLDIVDFFFDSDEPTSSVTEPEDNKYYKSLTELSGDAHDEPISPLFNSGLKEVKLRIEDEDNPSTPYWDGTNMVWSSTETWTTVTFLYTSTWTYTFNDANWTDGHTYKINSRAQDQLDNLETEFSTSTFTFDNSEGTAQVTSPENGAELNSLTQITGNSSASPAPVDLVEIKITDITDNEYWDHYQLCWSTNSVWFSVTKNPTWASWKYDVPTPTETWKDGHSYFIQARCRDEASNWSDPGAIGRNFSYDVSDPSSQITSFSDGAEINYLATISGTSSDSKAGVEKVEILITEDPYGTPQYWDGAIFQSGETWKETAASDGNGFGETSEAWEYDISTSAWTNGNLYKVQTKAYDEAGNSEPIGTGKEFTFDDEEPISTITLPVSGNTYPSLPNIEGTAEDYVTQVSTVEITIQRDPPSGQYYQPPGWGSDPEWIVVSGTASWSYGDPGWVSDEDYQIVSRAWEHRPNCYNYQSYK